MTFPPQQEQTRQYFDDEDIEVAGPPEFSPGTYPATCLRVRRLVYIDKKTKEEQQLRIWQFAVEGLVEGEPATECDGTTSISTGPSSKAFDWLVALLGAGNVEPNGVYKQSTIAGRECLVVIEADKNGYPKVQDVIAPPTKRGAK